MNKLSIAFIFAGLGGWACAALAAEPGDTHPCAAVADPGRRLVCYDEAFGEPGPPPEAEVSPAPAAPSPASAPSVGATAAGVSAAAAAAAGTDAEGAAPGEEEFGLSEAQLREREPEDAREKRPKSIEAVVTGIDYLRTRERVITLDNGQVWRETEVVTRARLAEGDTVTIKDAAFSSYLMVGPSARAVRVRRVK